MIGWCYHNPVRIVFGPGALHGLRRLLNGRRALLLTSPGFLDRGEVERFREAVPEVLDASATVPARPTLADLRRLYHELQPDGVDALIALGGGGIIDGAKLLSLLTPDRRFDAIEEAALCGQAAAGLRRLPLIAVPTTAGSGSEATPWAAVWDGAAGRRLLGAMELWPEACLVDPRYGRTLTPPQTAAGALTALGQCVDAVLSHDRDPVSTRIATDAGRRIVETVDRALERPEDDAARSALSRSALEAGVATASTGHGPADAICAAAAAAAPGPYGLAAAWALPVLVGLALGRDAAVDDALATMLGPAPVARLERLAGRIVDGAPAPWSGEGRRPFIDLLCRRSRPLRSIVPTEDWLTFVDEANAVPTGPASA